MNAGCVVIVGEGMRLKASGESPTFDSISNGNVSASLSGQRRLSWKE